MEAKFLKRLSDYKYALVCDLAQYESGFALLDVSTNALIEVQQISVSRTTDQPTGEMYQMFDEMVNDFLDRYSLQAEDLIIIKEQLPINCGPHSTAQTEPAQITNVSHKISLFEINEKLIFVLGIIPTEENLQLSLILLDGLRTAVICFTIIYKLFN